MADSVLHILILHLSDIWHPLILIPDISLIDIVTINGIVWSVLAGAVIGLWILEGISERFFVELLYFTIFNAV